MIVLDYLLRSLELTLFAISVAVLASTIDVNAL
jgi:hypothetical protein